MKLTSIAANRTEVELGNGITVFFSYQTPVAYYEQGKGYFKTKQYYSRTTSKHINKFLDGVEAVEVEQSLIDALVK